MNDQAPATKADPEKRVPEWRGFPAHLVAFARGIALFWGLLFALDVAGRFLDSGFDAATWWIDVRGSWRTPAYAYLALVAVFLLMFAFKPIAGRMRRLGAIVALSGLSIAMLSDGVRFLLLLMDGSVGSGFPIPLSFFSAASLVLVMVGVKATSGKGTTVVESHRWMISAGFVTCVIGFPLAQMFCFGLTDYSRPASIAVVFGARVYADGQMSNALAHRVHTACDLYRRGMVSHLIFSGGPGDGSIHETEAMRQEAIRLGVQPKDILLDPHGTSTQATVMNTVPMIRTLGGGTVLAVSHFYHLPRVKLCYQAAGTEVRTVPARQDRILRKLPLLMAREVVALWAYYIRAIVLVPMDDSGGE